MQIKATALAWIMVSALAGGAAPAFGAAQAEQRPGADAGELSAALQRDLGLSADQAKQLQAQQKKAIALDQRLRADLDEAFAGSTYDARTGKLVVMVSDAGQLAQARAAGANARLVKHSRAELDQIKNQLDAAAGTAHNGDAAQRALPSDRRSNIAGMASWYVDEATNTVRVTVAKGKEKAAARALAKYGDAVSVEQSDLAPRTIDRYQDGGDAINGGNCSTGFNLRNPSTGQGYLLTAGHCVSGGSTLYGHEGVAFGPVLESWFPGFDDAIARNDTGYYIQGPWVDTNPSHGGVIITSSYTDAPVGTIVCKSGITTKWTCGRITVKNETVTLSNGQTINGLTRSNACAEPGDSGGANVSVTTRYAAEGVSSAASLIWDGSRYRCRSAFGLENVSWYFPAARSIAYYGPKYGVTFW